MKLDLLEHAMPIPFSGCWIGMSYLMKEGYVKFGVKLGHRISWRQVNGRIPKGHEIHHKCKVKSCWNPAHLELKSCKDHKEDHPNQYSGATHCINGHEFNSSNTYIYPSGSRGCMECRRIYNREYMRKKRGTIFTKI